MCVAALPDASSRSIFVHFNHVTSGICAACEALKTFRASRDDRVGVRAGLDRVTLLDLLVKERVGAPYACLEDRPHPRAEYPQVQASPPTRRRALNCNRPTAVWSLRTRRAFAWASVQEMSPDESRMISSSEANPVRHGRVSRGRLHFADPGRGHTLVRD